MKPVKITILIDDGVNRAEFDVDGQDMLEALLLTKKRFQKIEDRIVNLHDHSMTYYLLHTSTRFYQNNLCVKNSATKPQFYLNEELL